MKVSSLSTKTRSSFTRSLTSRITAIQGAWWAPLPTEDALDPVARTAGGHRGEPGVAHGRHRVHRRPHPGTGIRLGVSRRLCAACAALYLQQTDMPDTLAFADGPRLNDPGFGQDQDDDEAREQYARRARQAHYEQEQRYRTRVREAVRTLRNPEDSWLTGCPAQSVRPSVPTAARSGPAPGSPQPAPAGQPAVRIPLAAREPPPRVLVVFGGKRRAEHPGDVMPVRVPRAGSPAALLLAQPDFEGWPSQEPECPSAPAVRFSWGRRSEELLVACGARAGWSIGAMARPRRAAAVWTWTE